MKPHYADDAVTVYAGDCLGVLRELPDASVDAVVTDPPYLLGFMGREWDTRAAHEHLDWHLAWCREAFRVLKPGGHLLAFGGTRTWHRLACAIEDAGFEIRDSIAWLYASGFPKSLDVSKAIDKTAGVEGGRGPMKRGGERLARLDDGKRDGQGTWGDESGRDPYTYVPATPDAQKWQGWGTALKPAHEPIVVARKPLAGTVAANVLQHGTGALNIDGCRVGRGEGDRTEYGLAHRRRGVGVRQVAPTFAEVTPYSPHTAGRWPANVALDEHQAAALDQQSGHQRDGVAVQRNGGGQRIFNSGDGLTRDDEGYGGEGGASRFYFIAKAPTDERPRVGDTAHPTVKPLDLMRWLVRLVTPPGGVVLDPFAGSGTTAEACIHEHKRCITIEREADYLPLIVARLTKPIQTGFDFGEVTA